MSGARCVDDVIRRYLPERWERERLAAMTPAERGEDIARRALLAPPAPSASPHGGGQ